MIEIVFLFSLALIWIFFATIEDLRTREISNWLNFSLIIFALGFRFFYSLFESGNFSLFYQGLIGLGIFLILGNLLYYARMFAGGDTKLMISLGAILPIFPSFIENLKLFFIFLMLFLIVGAIYGILRSVFIGLRNFDKFGKGFRKLFSEKKRMVLMYMSFGVIFLVFGFWVNSFVYLGIFVFIFPYFYLFLKFVDEYCMVKKVLVSELTPGDWLYKDVKIGKKVVKASWNGLSKEEIKLLKSKKQVFVRYGIVFAPVFLISFILLWIFLEFDLFSFLLRFFGV